MHPGPQRDEGLLQQPVRHRSDNQVTHNSIFLQIFYYVIFVNILIRGNLTEA